MKSFFSLLTLTAFFATLLPAPALGAFTDLPSSHWSTPAVSALVAKGVLSGYPDGSFRPDAPLNRAELAKVAVLLAQSYGYIDREASGAPSEMSFRDVPQNAWFTPYVRLGTEYGFFTGYRDSRGNDTGFFGPNDPVTRAQAVKVLLLATGINEDSLLSPKAPFRDVLASDWFFDAVTTAYNFSIIDGYDDGTFRPHAVVNRAALSKIAHNADPNHRVIRFLEANMPEEGNGSQVVVGEDAPQVDETTEEERVFVGLSLNEKTPEPRSVPLGATNVTYLALDITAPTTEDAKLTSLTVTRKGIGSPSDFEGVYLFLDGRRQSSAKTFVRSSNTVTFTLDAAPIVIPKGTTKVLEVRADLASVENGGTSGEHSFVLAGPEALTFMGAESDTLLPVQSTFPLGGALQRNVQVTPGKLAITRGTTPPSSVSVGESQVSLGEMKLEASGNEDVLIRSLLLENRGSASGGELSKLTLYDGSSGEKVAGPVTFDGRRKVYFDFSRLPEGGYLVPLGRSKRLLIKGDIQGGVNDTIQFGFDVNSDIDAVGMTYGTGVMVTDETRNAEVRGFGKITIRGGELIFDFASPEYSEVPIRRDEVDLAYLNIVNKSEPVLLRNFVMTLERTQQASGSKAFTSGSDFFSSVRLVSEEGKTLAGPADLKNFVQGADTAEVHFRGEFTVPTSAAGKRFYLRGDTGRDLVDGERYRFRFNPSLSSTFVAEGMLSGDDIASSNFQNATIVSDDIRILDEQLTVVLANTPTSGNVVRGGTARVIGVSFRAGPSGDLRLTTLKFTQPTSGTSFTSSDIFEYRLLDTDGKVLDTDIASGSDVAPTFENFTPLLLKAGAERTLYVEVKMGTATSDGTTVALALPAQSSSISVEDLDGNSLSTSQIFAAGVSGAVVNQSALVKFTVREGGELQLAISTDTPSDSQVLLGSSGIQVAKFTLTSNVEGGYLEKLIIAATSPAEAQAVRLLRLYDGTREVGTAQPLGANNEAVWSLSGTDRIEFGAAQRKTITITAELNRGMNDEAVAGVPFAFHIRSLEARGTRSTMLPVWGNVRKATQASFGLTKVSSSVFSFSGVTPAVGDLVIAKNDTELEHAVVVGVKTSLLSLGDTTGLANNEVLLSRGVNRANRVVLGSSSFTPGSGGDTLELRENIISSKYYPYNTLLRISEDSSWRAPQSGAPQLNDDLWRIVVTALSNPADVSPIEAKVKKLRFAVTGGVLVKNLKIINKSTGAVIATATGQHNGSGVSYFSFDLSSAADRDVLLSAGTSKTYALRGEVNSNGATGAVQNTLHISIVSLGSPTASTFGVDTDIEWEDRNAAGNGNLGRTTLVRWIDDQESYVSMSQSIRYNTIGGTDFTTLNTPFTLNSATLTNGGSAFQIDTGDVITLLFNEQVTPAVLGLTAVGQTITGLSSGTTGGLSTALGVVEVKNIFSMTLGSLVTVSTPLVTSLTLSPTGKEITVTVTGGQASITDPVLLSTGAVVTGTLTSPDEDGDPDTVFQDPDSEALGGGTVSTSGGW